MFLDLLIEVILLTVIVGGCLIGYRRGFFRLVSGRVRTLLCFVLSLSLCDRVGGLLKPIIYNPMRKLSYDCLRQGGDRLISELDGLVPAFVDLSEFAQNKLMITDRIDAAADGIAEFLSILISRTVAFLLLFLISGLLLRLLISLADSFLGAGPLGLVNSMLGATVSMLCAVLIAGVLASAVDYLFGLDGLVDSRLVSEFEGWTLYRLLRLII